jgi:hypothetical protein
MNEPLRHPDGLPDVPDHEMVRLIGRGSYGEVWLARNAVGTWRAVKVVYRDRFKDARPYEREFLGIQKYEPISRSNEGLVDVLQIGRNEAAGYFTSWNWRTTPGQDERKNQLMDTLRPPMSPTQSSTSLAR